MLSLYQVSFQSSAVIEERVGILRVIPNADASPFIHKIVRFLLDILIPIYLDYREKLVDSFSQFNV